MEETEVLNSLSRYFFVMGEILKGYKTYIGAAGVMLTAIGKVMVDWFYGNPIDFSAFIATFSVGLGILGIGYRIHSN